MMMPTAPTLTAEQRTLAAQRSLELRRERAFIKSDIAEGASSIFYVFALPEAQGMSVYDLLTAMPGVGDAKARRMMLAAGIAERNIRRQTVAMCGPRQREKLLAQLQAN